MESLNRILGLFQMLNINRAFLFILLLCDFVIVVGQYLLRLCVSDTLVQLISEFLRLQLGMGNAVHIVGIIHFEFNIAGIVQILLYFLCMLGQILEQRLVRTLFRSVLPGDSARLYVTRGRLCFIVEALVGSLHQLLRLLLKSLLVNLDKFVSNAADQAIYATLIVEQLVEGLAHQIPLQILPNEAGRVGASRL